MLTEHSALVGITSIALRRGETAFDDVCLLEVLLSDGSLASTWWETGRDWAEETSGQRVAAIQRASFKRADDLLVIECICDDGSVAELRWSGSRMWSFLTRLPMPGRPANNAVSVQ